MGRSFPIGSLPLPGGHDTAQQYHDVSPGAGVAHSLHPPWAMKSMVRGWDRRVLGLLLTALVLAVGFCVFDGNGHHANDHAGFDLCSGMLAAVVSIMLISRLPLAGLIDDDRRHHVLDFSPRVPSPPPRAASS